MVKNTISLEDQKKIMLDILEKTVVFLEKHELKYSLAFGTLLGAVRHGGFIPWDDDVDIMMPMEDYKRFIELAQTEEIAEDLFVSIPFVNPGHIWQVVKIISKKTKLIEPILTKKYRKCQEPFGGVYIDVFPVYGVPDDSAQRARFHKKICNLYKAMSRSSWVVNDFPGVFGKVKKLIYEICFIPYKIVGLKHYIKKLIETTEKYPFGSTKYTSYGMGFIQNLRDTALTEDVLDTIDMNFDGVKCKAPARYDAVLKQLYGDYMQLPPENQRKVHVREVFWRKN